jgi:hypothetical protein
MFSFIPFTLIATSPLLLVSLPDLVRLLTVRTAVEPTPEPGVSPTKRRRIKPLSQRHPFSALCLSQTADSTEGFVENTVDR